MSFIYKYGTMCGFIKGVSGGCFELINKWCYPQSAFTHNLGPTLQMIQFNFDIYWWIVIGFLPLNQIIMSLWWNVPKIGYQVLVSVFMLIQYSLRLVGTQCLYFGTISSSTKCPKKVFVYNLGTWGSVKK